jgi:hypothetical protein
VGADRSRRAFDCDKRGAAMALMIDTDTLAGYRSGVRVLRQTDDTIRPIRNRRCGVMEVYPHKQDRDDHYGGHQPAKDRLIMGRAADHARKVGGGLGIVKERSGRRFWLYS